MCSGLKKLLLGLILGLIFVNTAIAEKKSDKEQDRLKGPVKTVFIEIAKISHPSDQQVEGPRMPWLSTTYNRQGNRTEEDQLYDDESLNFKSVFTYDAKGRMKDGAEYDYKGDLTFKWVYTHDPQRKITEETRFEPDGTLFSKSTYTYDSHGNLIEERRHHLQISSDFKWVYIYDTDGKKREEAFYVIRSQGLSHEVESTLDFKSVYTYDTQGNVTEETHYDSAGSIKLKRNYTYQFDGVGNWVSQTAREWVTQAGESYFKPIEVTYRTITYYPP